MGLRPIGVGLGAVIWGRCSVGPVPNSGVGIWGCGPHLGGADPVLSSSSGVGGEGSGIHRKALRWRRCPTQPQKGFGVGQGHNCRS